MKTMLITAALLFASMLNMTAQTSEKYFVNNNVMTDGNVTTVHTCEIVLDTLSQKLKTVYDYDLQGRVTKRELMKWNERKQQWVNLKRWTYSYDGDRTSIDFAVWNKHKGCYNPVRDRKVYDFISEKVICVNDYKRNEKRDELQLMGSCLLMNNSNDVLAVSKN
jgi:hypothetical protein